MPVLSRQYSTVFASKMRSPYVQVLFGARQTGKSTLVRRLLPADAKTIDLAEPAERARFAVSPGLFAEVCRGLKPRDGGIYVFVDEAQTVPAIFDSVQSLYDADKDRYRFILCGSSARKLRATGADLLPGRSVRHVLHPLVNKEYGAERGGEAGHFPWQGIEARMVFGDLPGIALEADEAMKADLLKTYATSYLEEELQREAEVKDWGSSSASPLGIRAASSISPRSPGSRGAGSRR